MCPVKSFNGEATANTSTRGPMTGKLMNAYSEEIGFDYVAQNVAHIPAVGSKGAGL